MPNAEVGRTVEKHKISVDETLTLDFLQAQLGTPSKEVKYLTQDTVDEIKALVKDPEYGEEFLSSYIDYFNISQTSNRWSGKVYMSAMKFFVLVEGGHSLVSAYAKTFPERLAARVSRGQTKEHMTGEASRYNSSKLVNEIRKVASIGIQLSHRHLLHEALDRTADMMRSARSEMVRQKAAETLIRELKPAEDTKVQVDVVVDERDSIKALREAAEKLALAELQSIKAGVAVKVIAESKIIEVEIEDIE